MECPTQAGIHVNMSIKELRKVTYFEVGVQRVPLAYPDGHSPPAPLLVQPAYSPFIHFFTVNKYFYVNTTKAQCHRMPLVVC